MTLNEIVARIAADNNTTPEKARRLVEADLKLAKKFYPEIKHLNNEQILNQRFAANPATSQIAAIPMLLISNGVLGNAANYSPEIQAAAAEYKAANIAIVEDVDYMEAKQIVDSKRIEWTYENSPEVIAKAAEKTFGLREARRDVQEKFDELAAGRISEEQFSDYIISIEHELQLEIYDDDYEEKRSLRLGKPESDGKVSYEELVEKLGIYRG